jgi:hypothetical protein
VLIVLGLFLTGCPQPNESDGTPGVPLPDNLKNTVWTKTAAILTFKETTFKKTGLGNAGSLEGGWEYRATSAIENGKIEYLYTGNAPDTLCDSYSIDGNTLTFTGGALDGISWTRQTE